MSWPTPVDDDAHTHLTEVAELRHRIGAVLLTS
jgi:hypothetical protein